MVEYCMLQGVNDSIETAHTLGKLLQHRSVHVNLIPYNTTEVDAQFQSPSPEVIRAFHAVLREPYNLKVTVRENHGTDIDGACGQLALKNKNETSTAAANRDIEDLGRRAKPPTKTTSPKRSKAVDQATAATSAVSTATRSWIDAANSFLDRHQQAVGYSLLGASAVVFALGFARRAKLSAN